MQREPDYDEEYFLPLAVNDWVPEDHPARFVHELIESQDLASLGIKVRNSCEGRPSYGDKMLLKLWVLAYLQRVRASRVLEDKCRDSMGFIWLAGRMTPDHNTLWRFWSANREVIERLFKQSLRIARKLGLIGMIYHAIDGTKIVAASSRRSALHQKDLEKKLAALDEFISQIAREIEQAEKSQEPAFRLELENAQQRRQAIAKALEEMKAEGKERIHPLEGEAQMMMTNTGRVEWAYNAQAVVDDKHQIVVAADVSDSPNDDHNLKPMLDQVCDECGASAERNLGDSSYGHSEQELARVEQAGYEVVTARPKAEDDPYHVSKFGFDREAMKLVCPQGKQLAHNGSESTRNGDKDARVQCFICRHWEQCPAREQCCGRTRDKQLRARTVKIGPHHEAAMRQRTVVDKETRKALMHRRMSIVEPLFARLKWLDGFRRFSFRGKDKVRTQWRMMILTHNLRILMHYWRCGLLRFTPAAKGQMEPAELAA